MKRPAPLRGPDQVSLALRRQFRRPSPVKAPKREDQDRNAHLHGLDDPSPEVIPAGRCRTSLFGGPTALPRNNVAGDLLFISFIAADRLPLDQPPGLPRTATQP